MKNILKVSLIVVVVLAVAGGLFLAGSAFGSFWLQRTALAGPGADSQRLVDPNGNRDLPAPGNDAGNQGAQNDQDQANPPDGPNGRGGPGNMPGRGGGRMGPGQGGGPGLGNGMGSDGMGGPNGNQATPTPLTTEEAQKAAQDYIASLQIDGLELGEVLLFNQHAYVAVKETATGNGAFELMIDPFNKEAHPLAGPASLWNLKYGGVIQSDRLGRPGRGGPKGQNPVATATPAADATPAAAATPADVSADMPLTQEEAIKAAQTFLDAHYAGATVATTALKFYGYYSIDFLKDGKVIGKLSVNGHNGQVAGHMLSK